MQELSKMSHKERENIKREELGSPRISNAQSKIVRRHIHQK